MEYLGGETKNTPKPIMAFSIESKAKQRQNKERVSWYLAMFHGQTERDTKHPVGQFATIGMSQQKGHKEMDVKNAY